MLSAPLSVLLRYPYNPKFAPKGHGCLCLSFPQSKS